MKEEYKQAVFELVEKILIKYNAYSQIYIYCVEFCNKTLHEYFEEYYDKHDGKIDGFIRDSSKYPEVYPEWINGLINLRHKYKIYPV